MSEGQPTKEPGGGDHQLLERLLARLDELSWTLAKVDFAEYVSLFRNPRRLVFLNFASGIARGLGIAVGFTLLGAIVIYLLREAVMLNLPGIGHFLAQLIAIIQSELRTTRGA